MVTAAVSHVMCYLIVCKVFPCCVALAILRYLHFFEDLIAKHVRDTAAHLSNMMIIIDTTDQPTDETSI